MKYPLYLILAITLAALVGLNLVIIKSSAIGIILGSLYLATFGSYLGRKITTGPWPIKTAAGILLWLAILSAVSGVTYGLWNLSLIAVILIIILSPFALLVIAKIAGNDAKTNQTTGDIASITYHPKKIRPLGIIMITLFTTLLIATFSLLVSSRTGESLRSAWNVVPQNFFPIFFSANFFLLVLVFSGNEEKKMVWNWLGTVAITALALSVAFIIYEVGYGFDPFIHEATEKLIQASGLVEPKQLYYLGQYGLITILTAIFQIDVSLIDKLLLPTIASLALPTILFFAFRRVTEDTRTIFLAILTALALPLTWFINTTPQGLANLILISVVFIFFAKRDSWQRNERLLLWGLAIATMVIHPLAGLPALMLTVVAHIPFKPRKRWWTLTVIAFIVLGSIIPLLFMIQENTRSIALPTITTNINQGLPPLFSGWFYWEQRYNFVLDAIYHYGFNIPIIILALAAIGLITRYRAKLLRYDAPLLIISAMMVMDGLILNRFFPFRFLIDYERTAYGDRLLEMSIFFLLPFAALSIIVFCKKLAESAPLIILFWAVTVSLLRTSGLYLTYPRFDTYAYDRGYSTSVHDLKAVKKIEAEARGPYIVLANQAVSAAALKEIGFKQYFPRLDGQSSEQIFFYPIPTGGSLYQYYLKMVYEGPSRKNVEAAMNMVGVKEAYFVLNDYWADSQKIAAAAKQEADSWEIINGGKIYIFKYRQLNSP